MASTVTISQSPGDYNLAYGPNPVTLSNLTTGATKYVLQVRTVGGDILADIRQTANAQGKAIFDIQNILQTYVHVSPINTEQLGLGSISPANLQDSTQEVERYVLRIGDETNGTVDLVTASMGPYNVIGGKKPWYDLNWAEGPYQGAIQGDDSNPPCTNVYSNGQPLTDYTEYILGSELTTMGVAAPSSIGINTRVQIHDVFQDDLHTVSYFNPLYVGLPTAASQAQGIEGFRITTYESDGSLVDDVIIPNIVANGGGPNTAYGGGNIPNNNSAVITGGFGPQNLSNFTYTDGVSTYTFTLDPAVSYYYVQTVAYTPGTCLATFTGYADESLHWVQMYRIYDRGVAFNNSGCLDYDRIQFSWLNSFGFRDYYTFTKKNVRSTKRRANNFLANTADYNAQLYSTSTGARGYTTYSQEIQETFTAETGYMSDSDADYLEGLFNSPDVRVRLGQNGPLAYEAYFFGCNVTSASWTEKSYKKDKLFQYEIKFKLANNVKSQRG
jgi:hypothetical protein